MAGPYMKITHLGVKFNPLISLPDPLRMVIRNSWMETSHERYSRAAGRSGGAAGVAGGAVGGTAGAGGAGGREVFAAQRGRPHQDSSGGAAGAGGDWVGGCDSVLCRGADEEGVQADRAGAAAVS